ncbi:hypothetical protein, partial [Stieleria sp.]|uniref:hypothetical protein n=1 Tax=Stieleria sp. TaxID=2795976 RepID=UPI003565243B
MAIPQPGTDQGTGQILSADAGQPTGPGAELAKSFDAVGSPPNASAASAASATLTLHLDEALRQFYLASESERMTTDGSAN